MSSVSTSSLSESSDFVEYSQAQSSTVSSGQREEMRKKVYMRKKDRKASFNQQTSFNGGVDNKESSDSDSSPTNSTRTSSCSSYGSCNSTLSSGASLVPSSDSNSSYKSNSDSLINSSNISSDEGGNTLRLKRAPKTTAQKLVEEELASESLLNSHYITLHDESQELADNLNGLESEKANGNVYPNV